MATLVLSTVGSVLGGPVGGAIGSLIGHSIDQQLFAPPARQGPRVGDLAVQTSTYGTAIPRLYGTMRVAGSVIWASDLQESSTTQSGGKGSPEAVAYSYSVSLAVALSSRPIRSVKRIWADGKLIRGAAGDFKVRTGFRLLTGHEDQVVDPLIASLEGTAPSYRGLACAVFEDLDLSPFGNRIPFLTFETEADQGEPALRSILKDASSGVIDITDDRPLRGFAAHGTTVRATIETIVEQLCVEVTTAGKALVSPPSSEPVHLPIQALGCVSDGGRVSAVERLQAPDRAVPAALTVTYYDPDREYQAGLMRASAGKSSGAPESFELPAVTTAGEAKAIAETCLARRWAQRDRATLRLPPLYLGLAPGTVVRADGLAGLWEVTQTTLDGFVTNVELRPVWRGVAGLAADPGRPNVDADVVAGPTQLALLDLPAMAATQSEPVLHLAAASSTEAWRAVPLEIFVGGSPIASMSATAQAVVGSVTVTPLSVSPTLFDLRSAMEVELANDELWLESRDDAALAQGANLAAVGNELVQFGQAVPIGPRLFRLTRLLRGRFGTEWAVPDHEPGERFVLMQPATLREITLPAAVLGREVEVRAFGVGDGSGTSIQRLASGDAMRPPAPVHLRTEFTGAGTLAVRWVRRSRDGWAWRDEVEVPVGESSELYRIRLEGTADAIERESDTPSTVFGAADLITAGGGLATISIQQVGDRAVSRPTSTTILIP